MTTQVPPSALLPLNPEQLARLQAATTDLTPTQLAWVSGYFWGVLNQQPAVLAATSVAAAEMPGITPEGSPENLVNHYHIGIPLL